MFVEIVARHCLSRNNFLQLQKILFEHDPTMRILGEYLEGVKEFLLRRRAFNLLYPYHVFTGDFLQAGLLSIQLFTLATDWDARVGHLRNAISHLTACLPESKEVEEKFHKANFRV